MEGKVNKDQWKKMHNWIEDNVHKRKNVISIGTGGNISKLFEFIQTNEQGMANLQQLEEALTNVSSFTVDERINKLKMNPDRADVIEHASEIYFSAMKWAKSDQMFVPDLGLKDGILLEVYQNL